MIELVARHILPAALSLLPSKMDTPEARAMLLAIGLEESAFQYRRQQTGNPNLSPARGFWQFELGGGVFGVLTHPDTNVIARSVLAELRYQASTKTAYEALEHNDVLAAVFARLLLWTYPGPNPHRGEILEAWRVYHGTWRPGAFRDWQDGDPIPERWVRSYQEAWTV